MKSFEDILKEGKGKVKAPDDNTKKWRGAINSLMDALHSLNHMYGTTREHQFKIKPNNCKQCDAASFLIAVRDITQRDRIIKYHKGNWVVVDDKYYCEKCKKGKK